ncbi:MAG TPA: hypothetical protein VKP88_07910 [Candidatus Paceibacterota bacterium]|nr:hypothetical protein [Candidatus Paceibacterota bacterium]
MIDGRHLAAYAEAVVKKVRGFELYTDRPDGRVGSRFEGISVGLAGYPFVLGRLGYGDFTNTSAERYYAVASPHIENHKYGKHSVQHRYLMSQDMSRAVRNAVKSLRRFPHADAYKFLSGVYRTCRSNVRSGRDEEVHEAKMRALQRSDGPYRYIPTYTVDTMFNDAVAMAECVPDTAPFAALEIAQRILAARDEVAAIESLLPEVGSDPVAVLVSDRGGTQVITTVCGEVVTEHTEATCPQWLMGRLAVLSVLDIKEQQFIENVGYKHSDDVYCVTGPTDEERGER